MKLIWTWLAGLIIALALASPAAAQPNLDLRTTIDVDMAAPHDVFESMSKRLGCKLVIAPEITQPVTMRLQNVTVRTALTALSETLGCRWGIEGSVLHVELASSAQPGPSNVVEVVTGGVKGGITGGVSGGAPGGMSGGVAGDRNWSVDFQKRLGRKTPADFRFDNAPLSTIMNELGKVAEMEIEVPKPNGDSKMTIDLSNRPAGEALRLIALKAIKEQAALSKPLVFSLTFRGSTRKMLIMAKPTK